MSSLETVMLQLTCSYISETSIPSQYLDYPQVISAIQKHNWYIGQSNTNGWTSIYKIIIYSD